MRLDKPCAVRPVSRDPEARVPGGMLRVYRPNGHFDCPEHVNRAAGLDAFEAQPTMSELLHEGTLPRRKYTRFMLIGRT